MGVNASRVKAVIDVADAVLLRNIADGAETSTATETAVSLNELDTAYWQDGNKLPYELLCVMIHITAIDAGTGDETYTLSLQVDDTANMSDTPTTVWSQAVPRTFTGVLYAWVDARTIEVLDTDTSGSDKWIAIKATLAGTTPSLTYGAWIVKHKRG